jgi:phosphocarrier protein HPr
LLHPGAAFETKYSRLPGRSYALAAHAGLVAHAFVTLQTERIMNLEATQTGHRARVIIKNPLGLHLRPASQLVKLASQFDNCEVSLTKDGQTINAKSIMGVIMLAAEQGSELLIEATGPQSNEIVQALYAMVESGFGES